MINAGCRAGEKIALLDERYKAQTKLQRGSLNPDPRIRDAARDAKRDGDVRVFDLLGVSPELSGQ